MHLAMRTTDATIIATESWKEPHDKPDEWMIASGTPSPGKGLHSKRRKSDSLVDLSPLHNNRLLRSWSGREGKERDLTM